jgi:3-hydroxybutyryl-CoA dehydrogenase
MKLIIIANDSQEKELQTNGFAAGIDVSYVRGIHELNDEADAILDLLFENTKERVNVLKSHLPKPVLINAVADTLAEIQASFIRINAWPGFMGKPVKEIVASESQLTLVQELFIQLNWKYRLVPDVNGMISPRIIVMIVNEAWITYEDGISSKEEIDIAMKLGTNYPFGPFEWGNYIGMTNIKSLIMKLNKENSAYKVATSLQRY